MLWWSKSKRLSSTKMLPRNRRDLKLSKSKTCRVLVELRRRMSAQMLKVAKSMAEGIPRATTMQTKPGPNTSQDKSRVLDSSQSLKLNLQVKVRAETKILNHTTQPRYSISSLLPNRSSTIITWLAKRLSSLLTL